MLAHYRIQVSEILVQQRGCADEIQAWDVIDDAHRQRQGQASGRTAHHVPALLPND